MTKNQRNKLVKLITHMKALKFEETMSYVDIMLFESSLMAGEILPPRFNPQRLQSLHT